jgi:UDP-sulfoquinovose synthase
VYGCETDQTERGPGLHTRLDYDGVFGTCLNRFCVQAACGIPLTVYGAGGQTRGYINIRDTMRCIEMAMENPPPNDTCNQSPIKTYQVFNQITEVWSVNGLATLVERVGDAMGLGVAVNHMENPRVELEDHYYQPLHERFQVLGLEPHRLEDEVSDLIQMAVDNVDNVRRDTIMPKVKWK